MSNIEQREKRNARDMRIYELYRDEIKREDDITGQRTAHSMAFHGFLFASATFLISNPWSSLPISDFRGLVLSLLGVIGFLLAGATSLGIVAARLSLQEVSCKFDEFKSSRPALNDFPQIHGSKFPFIYGGLYSELLPFFLSLFWTIYLTGFLHYAVEISDARLLAPPAAFILLQILLYRVRGRTLVPAQELDKDKVISEGSKQAEQGKMLTDGSKKTDEADSAPKPGVAGFIQFIRGTLGRS